MPSPQGERESDNTERHNDSQGTEHISGGRSSPAQAAPCFGFRHDLTVNGRPEARRRLVRLGITFERSTNSRNLLLITQH
jgi:hypothetical protein